MVETNQYCYARTEVEVDALVSKLHERRYRERIEKYLRNVVKLIKPWSWRHLPRFTVPGAPEVLSHFGSLKKETERQRRPTRAAKPRSDVARDEKH